MTCALATGIWRRRAAYRGTGNGRRHPRGTDPKRAVATKKPLRNTAKRLGFSGARDRARTGDPQLGKLVSESCEYTTKSSSYEILKTDLVPAGDRLSRLEGGERCRSGRSPTRFHHGLRHGGVRRGRVDCALPFVHCDPSLPEPFRCNDRYVIGRRSIQPSTLLRNQRKRVRESVLARFRNSMDG